MRPRVRRFAGYVGLTGALVLTGCSSSGSDGGSTSPAGGGSSSPAGSSANAATTHAVTNAYTVFFDSRETTAHAVASLQHGSKFRRSIISEGESSYGKQKTTATVSSVKLLKANVAEVTFTVKVGGQTVLPNSRGLAVREGGKWKVASQTYCDLLKLEGTAPAICKDNSIIALPG